MRFRRLKYLAAIMLATGVTACGVTKYLPENSYMLNRNKVKADKDAPREERISSTQLEKYIPQRETKKFLGTNLPAWLYLQGGPDSLAGKGNLLKSIGSEPAILDSTLTEIGARNLKLYMNSRGFYESWSDYSVKYNEKRKKATVTYRVKQGEPFRIRNISYDFRDSFVEQVIREDSTRTLLKKGNIFDTNILKDERQRIADKLHNSGYFNFSISNISFKADTTVGDHLADITMVVRQHLAGYDDGGNPILENNSIYSIRNIYVLPNYDPVRAAGDSGYARDMDTTEYRGLKILTEPGARNNIRPQTLRRAINLYPDYLYSYELVQRTYDDILQLSYYKNARILFDEAPADDTGLVTYVGGEEEAGEAIHTSEKQLNCTIYCTPALRQGYTIDFEGVMTSMYYGVKTSATYRNRNLFRGAEVFSIGLMGAYEYYPPGKNPGLTTPHSYEIGVNTSIVFPRFLTPFKVDRANRAFHPQTKLEISLNRQERPQYTRTISGGSISYNWGNGRHSNYQFRPLSINVIDATLDPDFEAKLVDKNPYLVNSYRSQLVPAIGAAYVYSRPLTVSGSNSRTFRIAVEAAGNLTALIASAFMDKTELSLLDANNQVTGTEWVYQPFGIRFSQYARLETSFSNSIAISERSALVYRVMGGIGLPYGNSSMLPLDRKFYAGGINSMRGWAVRTLGPGGETKTDQDWAYKDGNMKLEANVEVRFPLWNSLNGAVFFDVGNVWDVNLKGSKDDDPGMFRFDSFFSQLGFNTGIGLRFDVNVAVIRLDWGIRIHDPNEVHGKRWIHNFRLGNTALNFGIGYPF